MHLKNGTFRHKTINKNSIKFKMSFSNQLLLHAYVYELSNGNLRNPKVPRRVINLSIESKTKFPSKRQFAENVYYRNVMKGNDSKVGHYPI